MVAEFERAGIDRSGFETERTLIWQDKATESAPTIWCRARVDLLGDRLILDLKPRRFPRPRNDGAGPCSGITRCSADFTDGATEH